MTREEQIERVASELAQATGYDLWARAERVVDALAQPDEVTDEMVERAWKAGQDDLPAGQRWDKSALRVALRAALEAGTKHPGETSARYPRKP